MLCRDGVQQKQVKVRGGYKMDNNNGENPRNSLFTL